MVKLVALLATLPVTALCVMVSLYAMKVSVLILMHWQAQIAISAFLYLIPMLVLAWRKKRRAERAAKNERVMPTPRPLREL